MLLASPGRYQVPMRAESTFEACVATENFLALEEHASFFSSLRKPLPINFRIRNLDAREARLVRLRYGLSDGVTRSIAECADAMGLSRTRVQQLNQRCLQKLREAAEAESLQEYLLTIA